MRCAIQMAFLKILTAHDAVWKLFWRDLQRPWGQSWPLFSSNAPFARHLHVNFLMTLYLRLSVFYLLVLYGVNLNSTPGSSPLVFQIPRYIPGDLYLMQYTRAYGVQRASLRSWALVFDMWGLFGPPVYLAWGVSIVWAIPSVSFPRSSDHISTFWRLPVIPFQPEIWWYLPLESFRVPFAHP